MQQLFIKPHMPRRIAVLLVTMVLMGFCVAIFDQLGVGTDPCSMMNLAVSRRIGWSFGTYQLVFNIVLTLIIIAMGEIRRIGLGTLASTALVGYSADFMAWVLNQVHPLYNETLLVKGIVFVPTMIVFLLVVAFYMLADLGVAPYDAMPQIITDRQKKFGFSVIRSIWDICIIIIGFAMGGTVGLVTIVVAFFLGPLFAAIAKKFQYLFE